MTINTSAFAAFTLVLGFSAASLISSAHAESISPKGFIAEEQARVLEEGGFVFSCQLEFQCKNQECSQKTSTTVLIVEPILASEDLPPVSPFAIYGNWYGSTEKSDFQGVVMDDILTLIPLPFGETVGVASLDMKNGKIVLSEHRTTEFGNIVRYGTCEEIK